MTVAGESGNRTGAGESSRPGLPAALTFPPDLGAAHTVAAFGEALATFALGQAQAHGARVWVLSGAGPVEVASVGRGLTLSDGALVGAALASGAPQALGMITALPFGSPPSGVLELVGGAPEHLPDLAPWSPLLGLALEGVQAREARRGQGRVAETLAHLVQRLGGSLDLGEVLPATAQSAAHALGFERAFVALFSEFGEAGAKTGEVFTYGFNAGFGGGIGVGPVTFETLVRRGEAIRYERERDGAGPLGQGLCELDPDAAVIAPLSARGRALGLLYVDRCAPGEPASEDDARLVLALAEQASLAIDNARLYALETRKRQAAEALREAGAALAGSLHLRETLASVLERAAALFGANAAGVYERQPDGRSLKITSALGLSSEYVLRVRAKVGQGVTGRVAQSGEALAVHDFSRGEYGAGSRYTRALLASGQYPYRGLLGLPLLTGTGLFGVLTLYWTGPLPLDAEDLALASVFAAQASLAIENARLYEEEARREREAAVLLGVGQLLGEQEAHADEQGALAEAARLAVSALAGSRGLIALLGESGEVTRCGTYRLHPPGPDELAMLRAQLGRGPRPLTRRACLPVAGSALIVPLTGGEAGDELLGFLYADDPGTDPPGDRALALARSVAAQMALTLTRERLLSALAREEARYRQLAEGAHDLILSADREGRVTYANPAARRLLEGVTGPLVGLPLLALASPESQPALRRAWEAAFTGPAGGRAEMLVGGLRLEARLSAVAGGEGLLVVARDLSELQQLAAEITRRGQALEAATTRQSELRSFLALFTQAQEEERRRISRELHDDTAQVLTASLRRAGRLARELSGEQQARAADLQADLNAALESVRRFARNLRPSVLDDLGLIPALEWLASQAQTSTRLELSGPEQRLTPTLELTLFRLVQEALNNVDKHAQAQSAAIRLDFRAGGVQVSVSDDGQGFTPEQAQRRASAGHLGLLGLRERAALAGGELEVSSAPGEGSTLTFWLPHGPEPTA